MPQFSNPFNPAQMPQLPHSPSFSFSSPPTLQPPDHQIHFTSPSFSSPQTLQPSDHHIHFSAAEGSPNDEENTAQTPSDAPDWVGLWRTDSEESHAHAAYNQRDPTGVDLRYPAPFNDQDYYNCEYDVNRSIGTIFAKSLYARANPNHIQGHIRARGGGERQWFLGAERSFLSNPMLLCGSANLELINQVQHSHAPSSQRFSLGEVVWRHTPVSMPGGYRLAYDPNPYIIIKQCYTTYFYVLLDSNGRVYPHLVPPECLELVRTTWVVARLPASWDVSRDVRAVLRSFPFRRHY